MTGSRNEFSRRLALVDIAAERSTRRLEATEAERAAIARRLDLPAVRSLVAEVTFKTRSRGRVVEVAGHLAADVVQTCVVTLEPLPARVEDDFLTLYVPEIEAAEVEVDPEGTADVEPLPAGAIDLGDLVVQNLSLALDPYPRAPGAELPPAVAGETGSPTGAPDRGGADDASSPPSARGEGEGEGPFAALRQLKNRS